MLAGNHTLKAAIALVAACLRNSTAPGDVVLDPFAGSGSTLMACEQLGRRARLLEIDPRYADVIVKRWEDYTGERSVRLEGADLEAVAA